MVVKHYDKSFKEQAVKLIASRGNISAVSHELGVLGSQLVKWHKDYFKFVSNSSPGRGIECLTDEKREIKHLQIALKDKDLDMEIFKKNTRADK